MKLGIFGIGGYGYNSKYLEFYQMDISSYSIIFVLKLAVSSLISSVEESTFKLKEKVGELGLRRNCSSYWGNGLSKCWVRKKQ
jgi:hypothetical protein